MAVSLGPCLLPFGSDPSSALAYDSKASRSFGPWIGTGTAVRLDRPQPVDHIGRALLHGAETRNSAKANTFNHCVVERQEAPDTAERKLWV